ncbi:alpha/beta hydrolase [Pseudonocardia sp. RS010]|uniref:alpha/beta hydrolase n=1 Tax=Pseudonocardia sp. RS010 TaxID=3385979 RepID=UPI00399EFC93
MTQTTGHSTGAVGEVGPPPPFDAECAALLAAMAPMIPDPAQADWLERTREMALDPSLCLDDEALARDGAYVVEERRVPGAPGGPEITLVICTPADVQPGAPALYYTHGGGMVAGSSRMLLDRMLDLGRPHRAVVVAVEYRLAPEHPDPAPIEDCYAGLLWTAQHAAELRVDPGRIVLAGTSAGGGLAAGLALLARDRGGPVPLGQMLGCPMLDDRNDSYSSRQMAAVGLWDRDTNAAGWQALLGERQGGDAVSPYSAPARATDLSGLPPAIIDACSTETFRDEAVTYATRIWQAGGRAELHIWPGGFHGYEYTSNTALAHATVQARQDWLSRLLLS